MIENIKVEILNRRHTNLQNDVLGFSDKKIDKAVEQKLIDRYPMRSNFYLPAHVRIAHRQLRNVTGKILKKVCNRYRRHTIKKETESEFEDYGEF